MSRLRTLMEDELEVRLNEMSELKPVEEEYKATADVTLKMFDRMAKLEELELQAEEARTKAEEEAKKLKLQEEANRLKAEELEESKHRHKIDTIVNCVTTAVKIGAPALVGIWLTKYERTDSLVSTATKEFMKGVLRIK